VHAAGLPTKKKKEVEAPTVENGALVVVEDCLEM